MSSPPITNGESASPPSPAPSTPDVVRLKERSWSIAEHVESLNATRLFEWIGDCIAAVVSEGCRDWPLSPDEAIPMGVTFSFPMVQRSLSEATLMPMGKGFVLDGDLELRPLLQEGYRKARDRINASAPAGPLLPPVRIAAIANDSVSTLVSFLYAYGEHPLPRKGCMGLIVGTGCNATIPLKLSALHESKRPPRISLLPGERLEDARIAVNTEWSINGSAPPLRTLGLVTEWDEVLDAAGELPGFQPLEYMTSGRYLGELGRLMLVDYLQAVLRLDPETFPVGLTKRFGVTTTFLSHFKPLDPTALVKRLQAEFPPSSSLSSSSSPSPSPASDSLSFQWTAEMATALYQITKAIQVRAAGILSAGIVALLKLSEDLPANAVPDTALPNAHALANALGSAPVKPTRELGVGYTGGCIAHFQDYLPDTQRMLDELLARELGPSPNCPLRVVLSPCHDGGIKGAGILAAAAQSSQDRET